MGESLDPPTSGEDGTFEALKKMTKKKIMDKEGPLGKHLADVKLIAAGKADNTFSVEIEDRQRMKFCKSLFEQIDPSN